jgi:sugar phosphate isomerase/epimerase
MNMFKYSFDALVYFGEPVSKSIGRLEKFGYDAIELVGEPAYYDTNEVNRLCKNAGMVVSSVCSVYTAERDLAHPDSGMRAKALEYVKSVLNMAAEVSAGPVIIAPTACMKTAPLADAKDENKWAVENIQKSAEMAKGLGLKLCVEAWNRYETYWLNRLDQAMDLANQVNMPNVGVMGDTFHMNLEEVSIGEAFSKCGDKLIHIHLADSNRAAPGAGHLDFLPVLKALKEMAYKGFLSFEILPASADPFGVLRKGGGKEFFDPYTKQSIDYIKKIEKIL